MMLSECYVGIRGKISNEMGKEAVVTFSLYPNPGDSASGYCRVSDGSNALYELFDSGTKARLFSDELEVTILLTSEDSFRVIQD